MLCGFVVIKEAPALKEITPNSLKRKSSFYRVLKKSLLV